MGKNLFLEKNLFLKQKLFLEKIIYFWNKKIYFWYPVSFFEKFWWQVICQVPIASEN